jgi:hypothetical protein
MSVAAKLTHRITIVGVGSFDTYGQRVPGLQVNDVPCFIDGKVRRVVDKSGEDVTSDFSILLLPSTEVEVGDTVSDGVDRKGVSLFTSGRVISLEDSNHPTRGRVVREIYVARN